MKIFSVYIKFKNSLNEFEFGDAKNVKKPYFYILIMDEKVLVLCEK